MRLVLVGECPIFLVSIKGKNAWTFRLHVLFSCICVPSRAFLLSRLMFLYISTRNDPANTIDWGFVSD